MNEQETWWSGEAGNEYTKRNRVDWRARIPFWHDIMKFTGARSVWEIGCNVGYNLSAILEACPHRVAVRGCDLNEAAAHDAQRCALNVLQGSIFARAELFFTAGVLIHIAPENLPKFMVDIVAASSRYVLAIEYATDEEQMVEYRGQPNLLWKRPYGKLYEELGLKLLHTGEARGFNDCTYWLLEKP